MKYSIHIKTALALKVRVAEFESFEEAKAHMSKFIIDLIDHQKADDAFDDWNNLKEDFPEEIQEILDSYEETGSADFEDDVYDEDDITSYSVSENSFEISGKPNMFGYSLAIETDAINMYDSDKNYHFTLAEKYKGGENEITIELLVNDGDVEVYNMLSDEARSRLEPVDYDE